MLCLHCARFRWIRLRRTGFSLSGFLMIKIQPPGNPAFHNFISKQAGRNSKADSLKAVLREGPSAINDDHLAGDERGLGEKHNGILDILRAA